MRTILFVGSFLFAQHAHSGGASDELTVMNFSRDGTSFTLTLKPVGDKKISFAPNCLSIRVHGDYMWYRWLFSDNSLIQRERHSEALDHIEKGQQNGTPIYFGVIGEGLKFEKNSDGVCGAESHALTVTREEKSYVYSFYKWP